MRYFYFTHELRNLPIDIPGGKIAAVMKSNNVIMVEQYSSPCGTLMLGAVEDELCMCDWMSSVHHERVCMRLAKLLDADFERESSPVVDMARSQLDEFFAGNRREFDVPLLLSGTPFQKSVWRELLKIPYGQTVPYGEVARRLDARSAVRAVANAVGANAVSIFVPCHRVVGSDGSLTGYAGGLFAKSCILQIEGGANEIL